MLMVVVIVVMIMLVRFACQHFEKIHDGIVERFRLTFQAAGGLKPARSVHDRVLRKIYSGKQHK